MNLTSLSDEEMTLEEVVQYYETSQRSLFEFREGIKRGAIQEIPDHLEVDILENWKAYRHDRKAVFSALLSALNYRHWMAHGRYWKPRLDRKYDFNTVYTACYAVDEILKTS
ncbi:hypothetical protein ACWKT5_37085 [Streptomyces avermitilis]